ASDLDPARAAWRYRRSVTAGAGEGFAALEVPPEVRAQARADLRDLRLLDANGGEVPYVADRVEDREAARRWSGRLVDQGQQAIGAAETTPGPAPGRATWA